VLLEIARAITQELDLDKLLGRILETSIAILQGQAGLIALRSGVEGWRVSVWQGLPPTFLNSIEVGLKEVGLASAEEKAAEEELPEISRLLGELTRQVSMGMLTGVGLPLIARHQVIGYIFIFRPQPNLFSADDRLLLSSFASQAAIAVQNAQLYTQLSRDNQRLDALLNSAGDGILILNAEKRIERCNPAFTRLIGMTLEDVQGRQHNEVVLLNNITQGAPLEQAQTDGWPLTPNALLYVEGDLKRGENQPMLPVGITYAPLLSPDGALLNIIATLRDITRFRQADELKSTFVSIVSHELKTPVALIKGYVSTLRREDAVWDKEIISDSLQVIEEEADRLTTLIENLLDASRLQAGGMKVKRTDVWMPDLARRIAARMQIQSTRHQLVVDFPKNFPVVLGDEMRLEQVLTNLIGNALKYAPEGEIRVSGLLRPDAVVICVSDQGPGIAAEDLPHVFDRFYRAPDAARNTKGAGLGLYLTRALIEAHGGRIWIEPGEKGTQICFSLPR
ncbi:MAG TPA: ATP-binding protein, partial [Anaerolineaceae bacterium]|nr:ATP-binding protein [Anaerolineaceae bacterium]